jgi:hypothetical protein
MFTQVVYQLVSNVPKGESAGRPQVMMPGTIFARPFDQLIGTLSKQDGNAPTTAIHTMLFLISYKRNE